MNIAEYLDRVKPLLVVLNIQYVYVIEEISAHMITSKLGQDSHRFSCISIVRNNLLAKCGISTVLKSPNGIPRKYRF